MPRHADNQTRRRCPAWMVGALWCVLLGAGCTLGPASQQASPRTQSDLLRDHYADLTTGRFAVIADFEEPGHAQLFHIRPLGADISLGVPRLEADTGISETGGSCLSVDLPSAGSVLVADNSTARAWLLKRDWRPYNLLLMNVHVPVGGLQLDLTIVSGTGELAAEAHSVVPLHAGWNLLRLDLGEAAEYVALDDVRALRWSFPGREQPATLRIDDVLLADNRMEVFGSPQDGEGRLYVMCEGRYIGVGVAGRFELGFAGGQIARWYALDDDPRRTQNLVGAGGALGPTPVLLPQETAEGRVVSSSRWNLSSPWSGELVAARQKVVEASAVRVVVECAWTMSAEGATGQGAPQAQWTYTIYPSGHVFVASDCTVPAKGVTGGDMGLVVGRSTGGPGVQAETHQPAGLRDRPVHRNVCYGWIASSPTEAGLLWVIHDSRLFPQMRPLWDAQAPRVSLVARGAEADGVAWQGACLLSLWPEGNCAEPMRQEVATSYCRKPDCEFIVGGLDRTSLGDFDEDGFNERYGTLMLATDANRVQLRLDGERRKIVNPAFCVRESAGRGVWVYVDYVIHEPVGTDADGNAVFQIPRVIDDQVIVEVYLRRASAAG